MSLTLPEAAEMYFAPVTALALVPLKDKVRLEIPLPSRVPTWCELTEKEGRSLLLALSPSSEDQQVATKAAIFDIPAQGTVRLTIMEGQSSVFLGFSPGAVHNLMTALQVWLNAPSRSD